MSIWVQFRKHVARLWYPVIEGSVLYGVRRVAAITLGSAVLVAVFSTFRGNQQILAWPLAFWISLLAWPTAKYGGTVASRRASVGSRGSWAIVVGCIAACIVSMLLLVTALSKPELHTMVVLEELARAENLARGGRLQEALVALETMDVPEGMPLARARKHHNCAVILIQLRRPELAVGHLLLALKYDTTNAQAAYLLAVLAADKGRVEEAKAMLDVALSIQPGYEPAERLRQKLAGRPSGAGKSGE